VANATVLSFGQQNGAGALDQNFLKVYGGEVIVSFEEACVTQGRFMERNIKNGKSAQFPVTWKVTASYHTPGNEITGQTSNANEKVITIDDLLIAPVFIASIDEAKSHYEVRSIYTREAGYALANQKDKNILQCAVLAARASALVSGGNGGTAFTSSGTLYRTSATDLAAGIYSATQTLDEKDVPVSMTRSAFVRPAQYYLLAQSTAILNRDWGGSGSYAEGEVPKIGGVGIVKTNHLPITNIASGPAKYQGDFSKTACVVANEMAAGTVKLLDLAVESDYDIRRQGWLLVAKYLVGHDFLRPDCSIELKTTT
jgi:hypothetical protein